VWKKAALLYFNFIVLADTNFNLESDKFRIRPIAPSSLIKVGGKGDLYRRDR